MIQRLKPFFFESIELIIESIGSTIELVKLIVESIKFIYNYFIFNNILIIYISPPHHSRLGHQSQGLRVEVMRLFHSMHMVNESKSNSVTVAIILPLESHTLV